LFPIKHQEHFDVGSNFKFEIIGGSPFGPNSMIRHDLTRYGTGPTLAEGSGSSFTYVFGGSYVPELWYARFYADKNNNQQYDPGEPMLTSDTFEVKLKKVYNISVALSQNILGWAAITPDNVKEVLNRAAAIVLRKDSADDYRAAVQFNLSGLFSFPATPSGGLQPDPASTEADRMKLFGYADVVILNSLPNLNGITLDYDWHKILLAYREFATNPNGAQNLATFLVHEMGHGVGLPHRGASPTLMAEGVWFGDNVINLNESNSYDS